MNIRFIKSSEKRQIIEKLKEQFGIENLPYLLIETGKEKIRAFSGSLSKEEIIKIAQIANVELIGIYFIKKEIDLRLSIDATHLLANQITKNIIKLTKEQAQQWLKGYDLDMPAPRGTLVLKYNEDTLGCGKSNGERIFNHVPKNRRIKN